VSQKFLIEDKWALIEVSEVNKPFLWNGERWREKKKIDQVNFISALSDEI
jgi:hypothetical protein